MKKLPSRTIMTVIIGWAQALAPLVHLSSIPPLKAGSPVAFLVATPRWPPAAAGLDLLWGAVPREGRHLGALKVVFCPQAHAGHVS